MLKQNITPKNNRFDFGVNLKKKLKLGNNDSNIKKKNVINLNLRDFFKLLITLESFSKRAFKTSSITLGRLKWNISRSIFFGRGIYFKYVSNLALLLVVSFGAFVYIGYDRSNNGFISRYSGVSASSSGVLFNSSGQTVIAQKQFKVTQYIVQSGDSLSSIAAKYSSQDNVITVDSIMWANGLSSSEVLKTGMKLDIPPVSGVLHTVKKGDTVIELAKKYKIINPKSSPEEINGAIQQITDLNLLDIQVVQTASGESRVPELVEGQRIIIPGGVIIAQIPVVSTDQKRTPISTSLSLPQLKAPTGQSFVWPVYGGAGKISQYFSAWHKALDISDGSSPYLVAMADGYVDFAGYSEPLCWTQVRIVYDNGYTSIYCHMSFVDSAIKAKVRVTQGQIVGRMGKSGAATGIHVHMVLKVSGIEVNPCSFEPMRSRCYK